jgi:hypothetical protein
MTAGSEPEQVDERLQDGPARTAAVAALLTGAAGMAVSLGTLAACFATAPVVNGEPGPAPPIGYSGVMPHVSAETTTPGHSRRGGGMS